MPPPGFGQSIESPTESPSSAPPTGARMEIFSLLESMSLGYTSVRVNCWFEDSTRNLTVEFMVMTEGGTWSGGTMSARASSASSASLPGKAFAGSASSRASSLSASREEMTMFGLVSTAMALARVLCSFLVRESRIRTESRCPLSVPARASRLIGRNRQAVIKPWKAMKLYLRGIPRGISLRPRARSTGRAPLPNRLYHPGSS